MGSTYNVTSGLPNPEEKCPDEDSESDAALVAVRMEDDGGGEVTFDLNGAAGEKIRYSARAWSSTLTGVGGRCTLSVRSPDGIVPFNLNQHDQRKRSGA